MLAPTVTTEELVGSTESGDGVPIGSLLTDAAFAGGGGSITLFLFVTSAPLLDDDILPRLLPPRLLFSLIGIGRMLGQLGQHH